VSDVVGSPLSTLTNDEFEQCVLGQIIVHDAWQLYASFGVAPEDFWNAEHKTILRAASDVYASGVSPDPVLIHQRGGNPFVISKCMDACVKVREENSRYMLSQLRELARARAVYYASQDLDKKLSKGDATAHKIVTEHLLAIDQIVRDTSEAGVVMNAEAQFRAVANLANNRESERRVWLGLLPLDHVIDGLSPGEILGLAARPGIGKTLWLGRYMASVLEYEIPTLMFSLEMPTAQIVTRLIQPQFSVSRQDALTHIASDKIQSDDYAKQFSNLYICDRAGLSVAEMEAITQRLKKQHDIGLVLIDHLGLIGGHTNLGSYERTSANSREIKDLAKRCEVSVVLAVQVSREAGGDGSLPLTLSSTRDSGVTEEVVDYLVGLHRPERNLSLALDEKEKYKDVVMARVLKNRHGSVGAEVAVHINPDTLEWTERPTLRQPISSSSKRY
tara:strand:- start:1715 stop:3052 length:1338 start_codon:yes stop_codon:yes gene_type:complete